MMKKIIGVLLLLSPLAYMTFCMVVTSGWITALQIWGSIIGLVSIVGLGTYLLMD